MANKAVVEHVDRTIKDLLDSSELFGGKVVVLGGDFRQTLPVVRGGTRDTLIQESIVNSDIIWPHVEKFFLTTNMRAIEDPIFSDFLLRVGNGVEPEVSKGKISLPRGIVIPNNIPSSLHLLIQFVYPEFHMLNCDLYSFVTRAILTTRNTFVDELNEFLLQQFPGEERFYASNDEPDIEYNNTQYVDLINQLSPLGLPPHRLILKKGCPIMLLRNLNTSQGLCNGTRLIVDRLDCNLLGCVIAVGTHKGDYVLIPRIPLQPSNDENCPVKFKRYQFPVRVCFAMTINKAQGQTLDVVGIYLREPVFSHGQLYVALSRARNSNNVKILLEDSRHRNQTSISPSTDNIVYRYLLQEALH